MIIAIVFIILAFVWLGYETKWLTVRLPYGIRELVNIQLIPTIVGISYVVSRVIDHFFTPWYIRLWRRVKRGYSERY